MKKAIYADKFFYASGIEGPGYLLITDGKFSSFSKEEPKDCEVINCSGKWIAPGLVDTHIHGLLNQDVMDNDPEGLQKISEGLLSCGVTSFLPTTLTASTDRLNAVVETIYKNAAKVTGARIEGIFLEGPFFTEQYKGAQDPAFFYKPSAEKLAKWQELSGGLIKKIAIAPELEGAKEFVKYAVSNNVKVALAHSNATYQQAKEAVESGANIFIHTYNGMSPLHHREPGMVGAAMSLKDVFAEVICDGHHVHPIAAKILMDARGRDHTVMVTDCMRAGAMPDGDYTLGDSPVTMLGGVVRLKSNNSLAGSVLQLKDAVKNVVEWEIATPFEAVQMATSVPAQSVGIDDRCGKIAEGRNADFIVLTPQLDLLATYLAGELRYEAQK